ncbi:DUF3179 domain-containing (seleno)protein [Pinibacter aurantiacus]|uniref:DUF3179 domain-containing protein n=1 Tax=Pinibacter aurantiacus TaxID=2851599 RepID=A0A9E2W8S3_9BACT|nr:DUF3179 domain-containing (seleno)protein [Pinibacter aurantiacus]MBV4358936.1 DUF3179 domain-containing protein [Pinibacter aurantiacus]
MKRFLLLFGLLLLFAVEILRVYFIMPFPGSQKSDTIDIAYWLHNNIKWLRIVGLLLIAYPVWQVFKYSKIWKKVVVTIPLLLYAFIFFMFNYRFQADKMFYQPVTTTFAQAAANHVSNDKLVIGVEINGEAKAYPVQIIGYHHQVRDTVGNVPVMITYCTVCRTGRVFSPMVDGKPENFRLVGMDHFNAMFEDATTKSWWRQVTGEAIAGKLKGKRLTEIPSQQSTLSTWLISHPNSAVLQPDTIFNKQYADLAAYDKGIIASGLEKRDSGSWKFKSWVVGVVHNDEAKAYDWNVLVQQKMIQDSIPGLPLLITLDADTASFHVLNRTINGNALNFQKGGSNGEITDIDTHSLWNSSGVCISGPLQGKQLSAVQAYQEFWHSWHTFHPYTMRD